MREDALQATAEHRGRETRPLGPLLVTLRESRQQPWAAYRARVGLSGLPERYADVVDSVVDFLDGLYANRGAHWEPTKQSWCPGFESRSRHLAESPYQPWRKRTPDGGPESHGESLFAGAGTFRA
jgi:hypothetical protein